MTQIVLTWWLGSANFIEVTVIAVSPTRLLNNTSFSGNIKPFGFSVTLVGFDSGAYCTDEVLAHEIGHNLGNIHDLANSGNSTPYRPYGYGDGISGVFGTVQSYLSPEQGKFSSPNLSCAGGYACGRYSYTNVVQAIDDVRSIVAEVYSGQVVAEGLVKCSLLRPQRDSVVA